MRRRSVDVGGLNYFSTSVMVTNKSLRGSVLKLTELPAARKKCLRTLTIIIIIIIKYITYNFFYIKRSLPNLRRISIAEKKSIKGENIRFNVIN